MGRADGTQDVDRAFNPRNTPLGCLRRIPGFAATLTHPQSAVGTDQIDISKCKNCYINLTFQAGI